MTHVHNRRFGAVSSAQGARGLILAIVLFTISDAAFAQNGTAAPHVAATVGGYAGSPATAPMGAAVPVVLGRPGAYSATDPDSVALAALSPQRVYIADTGANRIVAIVATTAAATQASSRIAGSPSGASGSADGDALTAALFNSPHGVVAVLPQGADGSTAPAVYVVDSGNHCLRHLDQSSAVVATLAGLCGTSGDAPATGTVSTTNVAARFVSPTHASVVTAAPGALVVTDTGNRCIRHVTLGIGAAGTTTTFAGTCGSAAPAAAPADGAAVGAAELDAPWGIQAVRGGATVYFTEKNRGSLRKIEASVVSTVIAQGTGVNPTLGLGFQRPLAGEAGTAGTLVIAGTTAISGSAPTGGLLTYDERDRSVDVFANLPAATQPAVFDAENTAAYVAADTSGGLQTDSVVTACCPRAPIVTSAVTAPASTTAGPAPTTAGPRTRTVTLATPAPPPRTPTKSMQLYDSPIAVPSTFFITATSMADVDSPRSERSIELHLLNAAWNLTWCATEPTVQFRANNSAGFGEQQPCGLLQNANEAIGLNSIECTETRLLLTFQPFKYFALINNDSEDILYEFAGNYLRLPPGAAESGVQPKVEPLPIRFVANQVGNVTCDPNATIAPPPTNATTMAPVYRIPWPSQVDVFLWNIVAGVAGASSIAAGSTAGVLHVVWMHRMALLCSHNCNWQNVSETAVPLQNNPTQVNFAAALPYWSDYDSEKFAPFLSGMLLNLAVCLGCSLLHALVSVALGVKSDKGVPHGMATAHFPAAWTFPIWAWFYVPTVSAATTIFARSSEAPELDAMAPGIAGLVVLVFLAVIAAHAVLIVTQLKSRSVKIDPKAQKTHWLTTPIQIWGDRLGFEGYTERFGAIFWMFSNTRHWYFFAEFALLTIQAGMAAYRSLFPDCQTGTFTPIAITGVLGLFASLVLDPFLVFTDRIASYAFNGVLIAGAIVAAFAGDADEPLEKWATRVDQVGMGAMVLAALYAIVMAAVVAGRWGQGIKNTAETATEAEERKLASKEARRVGAEGEPKELIKELTPEEEEEMRRQAEEEARLANAPALDPSVLAEPDPELREVLMRGNWVRMETEEGPYYYNRHTGKSVWDLRDEIGLPPLYRKRFQVADLSDDDTDEDAKSPLGKRLLDRARSPPGSKKRHHDPVAAALARREWVPIVDPGTGRTYYANTESQETTWDLEDRLGCKDEATKQREREEEERKLAEMDPLQAVLDEGDWVRVEPEGGGKPYYYHAASRKTVWNLRKELGLPDPQKEAERKSRPPPPPPPIEDRTVVPAADIERLANLMSPEAPADTVPSAIAAEAKLWWLPQTTEDVQNTTAANPLNNQSPILRGPIPGGGDMSGGGVNTSFASPSLMRMLQEQQELPTRRDDPVSLQMAHALATGQWVELPPAHEGEAPSFINMATKEVTRDLRGVFEATSVSRRDPVQAALDSKEWISMVDPVTKRPFYVHVVTKRTTFDLKRELAKEARRREKKNDAAARSSDRRKSGAGSKGPLAAAGGAGILTPPPPRRRRGIDSSSDESAASLSSSSTFASEVSSSASAKHHHKHPSSSRRRQKSKHDDDAHHRRSRKSKSPMRPPKSDAPRGGGGGGNGGMEKSPKAAKAGARYGSTEYYQELWDCL